MLSSRRPLWLYVFVLSQRGHEVSGKVHEEKHIYFPISGTIGGAFMKTSTKRRLAIGSAITALVAAPFLLRNFRKTTQLPEGPVGTFPALRDPSVVPSGKVDVVNDFITFEPLTLPESNIRSWTLNAVLSNDSKWILVSYRSRANDQSQICYAPLDKFGLPKTFADLKQFGLKTAIYGLGCSSVNSGRGHFSYGLRKVETDANFPTNSLYRVPFQQKGKAIECSSEPVVLDVGTEDQLPWESFRTCNHCWMDSQKEFFLEHYEETTGEYSLVKASVENAAKGIFAHMRNTMQQEKIYENGKLVAIKVQGNTIVSNLLLQNQAINFLEAPIQIRGRDRLDPAVDPYRTSSGLMVSMDLDGRINSEKPFPVPSWNRTTLMTRTHCFFPSTGGQFFLTAALENPQDYFELRFSKGEIELPGSGINYVFDPLLILPSGRHLLCARDVGRSYIDKAKEIGIPLSELGIIELPFRVG